jgi:hypothetical protein
MFRDVAGFVARWSQILSSPNLEIFALNMLSLIPTGKCSFSCSLELIDVMFADELGSRVQDWQSRTTILVSRSRIHHVIGRQIGS